MRRISDILIAISAAVLFFFAMPRVTLPVTGMWNEPVRPETTAFEADFESLGSLGLTEEQVSHLLALYRTDINRVEHRIWDRFRRGEEGVSYSETLMTTLQVALASVLIWWLRNRTRGDALTQLTESLGDNVPTLLVDATGREPKARVLRSKPKPSE